MARNSLAETKDEEYLIRIIFVNRGSKPKKKRGGYKCVKRKGMGNFCMQIQGNIRATFLCPQTQQSKALPGKTLSRREKGENCSY